MASEERCHYIGHLAGEPEACVAMTGCVGSEDVEFSILSTHAKDSSTFMWTKQGKVKTLKAQFQVRLSISLLCYFSSLCVLKEAPLTLELYH